MGRELRNQVTFGVGMPKARHCSKTDESTSRVTSEGGKLTNDGLTVNNNDTPWYSGKKVIASYTWLSTWSQYIYRLSCSHVWHFVVGKQFYVQQCTFTDLKRHVSAFVHPTVVQLVCHLLILRCDRLEQPSQVHKSSVTVSCILYYLSRRGLAKSASPCMWPTAECEPCNQQNLKVSCDHSTRWITMYATGCGLQKLQH